MEINDSGKYEYLLSIYKTIIIKDIITRKDIKEPLILESVVKFLFDNVGNAVSINKIANTLISYGRKSNTHTVEKYINALIESYVIYKIGRYDIKGKEYLKTMDKYYLADIGLRHAIIGYRNIDWGHLLENIVFLELRRRKYQVSIGKVGEYEVDFVASNNHETVYIQVCESVRNVDTLERELRPLELIRDHNFKMIITLDNEMPNNIKGIKITSIYDFLMHT